MDTQMERHDGLRSCSCICHLVAGRGASVGVDGPTPSLVEVMADVRHFGSRPILSRVLDFLCVQFCFVTSRS